MLRGRAIFGLLLFAVVACGSARAGDAQMLPAPKGEEIWYVSDHALPMIAMSAALPAGSAYDPHNKFGLATFAASLLDEGAGSFNATTFQTALSNRAIRLSVTPGKDYLVISLVTLADNAKDAFQLLGLALSRPRFDPDAINRVRAQILSSIAEDDEDPSTVASKAFARAYFHDHAYGHPIDGDPASIASINQSDLRNFAAQHWVRGDLRIAVSGDVDAATLTSLLNTAFGRLSPKAPPLPPWPGRVGQSGVEVVPMHVPQPSIAFGLPGVLRKDRDYMPALVANYIIGGGGFSSRLTSEVRVARGLTYDIDTSLDTDRRAGLISGAFATKEESVQAAIGVVRNTLQDFAANGPTDKEVADAKTYLIGSFPLSLGSNVGIASELNDFQQQGLPFDYIRKREALINAVTAADVKRVAARLFNPRGLTIVVAGSLNASERPRGKPSGQPRAAQR